MAATRVTATADGARRRTWECRGTGDVDQRAGVARHDAGDDDDPVEPGLGGGRRARGGGHSDGEEKDGRPTSRCHCAGSAGLWRAARYGFSLMRTSFACSGSLLVAIMLEMEKRLIYKLDHPGRDVGHLLPPS